MTNGAIGDAPVLSHQQLVSELERVHNNRHRTRRTCLFGRLSEAPAEDTHVTAPVASQPVRFSVRQVASELELRMRLVEDTNEDVIYLVPFTRALPRDLAARFAGGQMREPSIERHLPKRFGARRASPRLLNSELMRVARLESPREYALGTETENIDLDDAWLLHLRAHLELDVGQLTLAPFFQAVLTEDTPRGEAYATLLSKVPGARDELKEVLARRLGPASPVVFDAWLSGTADLVGAAALVGEGARAALRNPEDGARSALLLSLESSIKTVPDHPLRPVLDAGTREALARTLLELGAQVALVWPSLRDKHRRKASQLIALAEGLLAVKEARDATLDSNRLPFTFEHRRTRFSEALKAGTSSPNRLREMKQSLLNHELAKPNTSLGTVAQMALRLAVFARLELPASTTNAADEVTQLSAWQAEHGGYLDWARHELRRQDAQALSCGVDAVLAAADAVRDTLNERFARAWVRLNEHRGGRKNLAGAVAIESALGTFGLATTQKSEVPRFLVVCMDGMSWANFAELRGRTNSRLNAFVPLTTASQSEGERPPPVLAQVPTITKLSRTALFLGRELGASDSLDSGRDPDRFAAHPATSGLTKKPNLWLKRDLPAPAGKLNDDVRKLLADASERVVGVVVNAIDDQLKGGSQIRVELSVDAIPVLNALLEAAEQTGRLVLICSDHGNVPSDRFGTAVSTRMKSADYGARWRWLTANDEPLPTEVVVTPGALPRPNGATQLAVPFDETTRYTSQTNAGEHGGLTLSEVVAPTALLAPPGLVGELVDERGLFKRATLVEPRWWHGELDARPAPAVVHRAPTVTESQATLFPEDERIAALLASELFKLRAKGRRKEDVERVRKGLSVLLASGGRLGAEAFGREVGIALAFRVPGYVATMQELVNVDQERVVGMDDRRTLVELDVALLEKTFLGDH